MKYLIVTLACFCTSLTGIAQDAPKIGCKDGILSAQAAEIKASLTQQGFEQINDGMLTMTSHQGFPVMVRMKGGQFYQILFVGNTRAKKMSLDMGESTQGELVHKEQHPLDQTSNVINFSFTPKVDGDYLFQLEQILKSPGLLKAIPETCGSFTIFRLKQIETPGKK
jgi:hypothetical protein